MSDLVKRLRIPWEGMGDMANAERAEAADEIERLRRANRSLEISLADLLAAEEANAANAEFRKGIIND